MTLPKVCHMTSVHPPFDNRIFHKECKTLVSAGYEVTLIAPYSQTKVVDGIKIHAVPKAKNRLERMIKTTTFIYIAAIQEKAQVYHFHDPELIPVGLLLRLSGARVIYDVHEDYTSSVRQRYHWPYWIRWIIIAALSNLESLAARFLSVIIAERYYQRRFPEGVQVLNYPQIQNLSLGANQREFGCISIHLLYTGTVSEDRGALIYAEIVKNCPDIEITLVGRCSKSLIQRIRFVAGKGAERLHIECTPEGVPFEQIRNAYRRQVWLAGIAIFPPTEHYVEKELTKFYEYMAVGLPIICSDFPAWRRLIEESDAGMCVNPDRIDNIQSAIMLLANNQEYAEALSRNGQNAVNTLYSWETQAERLLSLYESLC